MGAQPAIVLPLIEMSASHADRLAALFDAHEPRLYPLARRLTATADDAHDLVQETFLRAAKSLSRVPSGFAKEEAWLVCVLVNIARDQWRKQAVRQRSAPLLRADAGAESSGMDTALMTKQAVWSALDQLHPRRRAVVVMHELDGRSVSSIATLLGVAAMTVRWHLSMGRRDLKRILQPICGDLA